MNDAAPGTGKSSTDLERVAAPISAFDFLLSTESPKPAEGEAEQPLRPSTFDFSDRPERERPHAGALDWASLAFAFVVPPLGLILSIATRIYTNAKHGWTTGVARAATVIGIILTLALIAGGIVLNGIAQAEAAEAAIVADSAAFCAALDETPGVLDQAAYGWPNDRTTLPETTLAMQAYHDRWVALTDVAPSGVRPGVRSVANAAQSLITAVETTRSIDRQRNLDQMSQVTAASGIPAYVAKYCR